MKEQSLNFLYDLESYNYTLPQDSIAQTPAEPRDSSRLLVWNVNDNFREHRRFRDIVDYLKPGDLLVLNDTRVLPARLWGEKEGSGGKVEFLLLSPVDASFSLWKALVRPGRRLPIGTRVEVGDRQLVIEGIEEDGLRILKVGEGRQDVLAFLDRYGEMPLPPYIQSDKSSRESYQTVFAAREGSAAAPTASLHYTRELLQKIADKGVALAYITLHVGLGTFRPVKTLDIREHPIHSEYCEIPESTVKAVEECRARGGRVIAAGTTVTRTLESMGLNEGLVQGGAIDTRLFIYPGFSFKVVDALITNFHLPKSSLLMLVSAFIASLREDKAQDEALKTLKETYLLAIQEQYRFFSYGDAMFIKK